MSLDHLPANIEEGVQNYAAALHISHDEAVIRTLETGLTVIKPDLAAPPAPEFLDFQHRREAKRKTKMEALAKSSPEKSEAIFGAFAKAPRFRESIDAVIANRAKRYGFPE